MVLMAEIDKVKEEINWLKVAFGLLIIIDISLVAWFVENYENIPNELLYLTLFGILLFTVGIVIVNRRAYKKINKLGEL